MQRREIEKQEFALYEIYGLLSYDEERSRETDLRTTVYKKKYFIYQLRMKSSDIFLSAVEKPARMDVIECAKHDLVQFYPI